MRLLLALCLCIPAWAQPPSTFVAGNPILATPMNSNLSGLYTGRIGRWTGSGAPGNFPFSLIGDIYFDTSVPGRAYGCYQINCTAVGAGNWVILGGTVTVVSSGTLGSTRCVSGGGSQALQTPSANCTIDSSGNITANSFIGGSGTARIKLPPVTYATLNADYPCAGNSGNIASVSDSNTQTWGATVAGGGVSQVLAYCNGTNYTVIGK